MFLEFYSLREQPFGVTPDPRYLYFSPGHREALASLFYGIETGRGFLGLIAQPGMGKTTLLFQLLDRLKSSCSTALLFQTQCDSKELLRYVLEAFGLDSNERDTVQIHRHLYLFLFREALAGRRVVLVVDEAQNLSDSALETVRLLSDFEAHDKKLLHIVLAGQPELAQRLSRPGLSQLRQRIAVLKGLAALPPAEVVRYIHHRLQVAGYAGPELFTPAATALISERSQGIPRNINNICFNALSLGCAMGRKKIDTKVVEEATADQSLDALVLQPQPAPAIVPATHPVPRPFFSRLKEKLPIARFVQAAVLFAAFGGGMIYFAERSKAGLSLLPHAIRQVSTNAGAAYGSVPPAASPAAEKPGEVLRPAPAQTGDDASLSSDAGKSSSVFTYVVQPRDTLRDLCLWFIGRYDESVVTDIGKLNQGLQNPNRIVAGQQIRFPLYPQTELNIYPGPAKTRKSAN